MNIQRLTLILPLAAVATLALASPALAAEEPSSAPAPTPAADAPPATDETGEVVIACYRKPTVVEQARLRWDDTHRRLDSRRGRELADDR